MSSLVYSEKCGKNLLQKLFSNPTLKTVPGSREYIPLFFLLKIISVSYLFNTAEFLTFYLQF